MDLTSSEPPPPEAKTHRTLHPALVQLTGMHLVGGHGRTSGGGKKTIVGKGCSTAIWEKINDVGGSCCGTSI